MVSLRRPTRKVHAAMRSRLIQETELALTMGILFPETVRRIPTVEAGKGVFKPAYAMRFWQEALQLDEADFAA